MVLRIILKGQDTRAQIGALKVVSAFCVANREGQQALLSTIPLRHLGIAQAGLLTAIIFCIDFVTSFFIFDRFNGNISTLKRVLA